MHTRSLRRRLVLALSAIAVAMIVLVLTGAARSSSPSPGAGCTHGLSSIGPVSLENGEVSGSTTPRTEACLP